MIINYVVCDKCMDEDGVDKSFAVTDLTALYIYLDRFGWAEDGDKHYCSKHKEVKNGD